MTTGNFLDLFRRTLELPGSIYMQGTCKAVVRAVTENTAKERHWPSRGGNGCRWHPRALLSKETAERLERHELLAVTKGFTRKDDVFVHISRNPLSRTSQQWCQHCSRRMCPGV